MIQRQWLQLHCDVYVVVTERVLTVPSSAEIAKIDKESFHQQKFKSGIKSSTVKVCSLDCSDGSWLGTCVTEQQGKKSSPMISLLPAAATNSEQDHDNAIFGSEHISVSTTKSSVVQEEPMAVSVKVCVYMLMHLTYTCTHILFCYIVQELPSSEKQARWLQKLQKMRSKFPDPPSDEPIQSLD